MTDFNKAIQDAAAVNGPLLATLNDTDYAAPALKEQERHIVELDKQIKELVYKINVTLHPITERRKENSGKYESSIVKRFAYKATGQSEKFDGKASEEERKYVEALEEEHNAISLKESLQAKLDDARAAKAELEPLAKQNAEAQAQIDNIYQNIFDGPTPSFPEEDEKEEGVRRAYANYQDAQAKVDAEKRVVSLLREADGNAAAALKQTESARSASRADMFGGGMICDMMERSALQKAQQACDKMASQYRQAQQISPHVKQLKELTMADGHLWSDMFFDTLGGDWRMHQMIKESQDQVLQTRKAIEEQTEAAKGRVKELQGHTDKLSGELASARKSLQDARTQAIEQVAHSHKA